MAMRFHADQLTAPHSRSEPGYHPSLSRREMVAIIDALLQAEMTLPLLDERNRALGPVQRLRTLQLSLANRLEDLLAEGPGGPAAPP